jgi:hypothetical protein
MKYTKDIIEAAIRKLNDAMASENPLIIRELLITVQGEIQAAQNVLDLESLNKR